MEGAATCNLEGEHSVLDKKKVRFSTSTHRNEGLLDCVHVSIWGPAKTTSLGGQGTLSHLLMVHLGRFGYIP